MEFNAAKNIRTGPEKPEEIKRVLATEEEDLLHILIDLMILFNELFVFFEEVFI